MKFWYIERTVEQKRRFAQARKQEREHEGLATCANREE